MIAMTLLGCVIGAAVFGLVVLIRPPQPDPLVMLARFDADRAGVIVREERPSAVSTAAGLELRLGQRVSALLAERGVTYTTLRQNLALNGQPFDAAMGRKVVVAVAGFLIGLVAVIFLGVAGIHLPLGAPVVVALLFAAGFFFIPDIDAKTAADKRRREFRLALSAYLEWVHLQMSGLASAEQAVPDAAKIGAGWPLALIRHTVSNATRSDTDVWVALSELGERIGVAQLRELGTLIQQVAHDGAQVRETLAARAASLREQELADAEGSAGQRDQSMLMAQILIGVGFAVFLGYPAIINFLRI